MFLQSKFNLIHTFFPLLRNFYLISFILFLLQLVYFTVSKTKILPLGFNMFKQLLFVTIMVAAIGAYKKKKPPPKVYEAEMTLVNIIRNHTIDGNDMPFSPGFVRLAFHDCVGLGGCDGCIDHTNPSNGGLKRYTNELDYYFDNYDYYMSRADFYALASVVALGMSTAPSKDKFTGRYHFKFGRKSCKSSPNEDQTDEVFPSTRFGIVKVIAFFKSAFPKLTTREVVALLGVHTLGRARMEDSGHEGRWVNNIYVPRIPGTRTPVPREPIKGALTPQSTLDNEYYHGLLIPWRQHALSSGNKQWFLGRVTAADVNSINNRGPNQNPMLFNSDFCFVHEFHSIDKFGTINCHTFCPPGRTCNQTPRCPPSETKSIVQEFADDNAKWVKEFSLVFMKMIQVEKKKKIQKKKKKIIKKVIKKIIKHRRKQRLDENDVENMFE